MVATLVHPFPYGLNMGHDYAHMVTILSMPSEQNAIITEYVLYNI